MSEISKLNHTSLPQAKALTDKQPEEKLREVSDMYEKYFMKEMLRQMRSTVHQDGFIKANNAEKIFQDQLDDQYSGEWNKQGGFGISDLIYNQLVDRFGEQFGIQKNVDKPHGPIPLNQRIQVKNLAPESQNKNQVSYAIKIHEDTHSSGPIEIKNPWAGVLQKKQMLEGDKTSFQIKHDNGLESVIIANGAASEKTRHLSPGTNIGAGQALGLAQVNSPLVWTVKKSVSE